MLQTQIPVMEVEQKGDKTSPGISGPSTSESGDSNLAEHATLMEDTDAAETAAEDDPDNDLRNQEYSTQFFGFTTKSFSDGSE